MRLENTIAFALLVFCGCLAGFGLSSCASRPPSAGPPALRKVEPESAEATRSKIGQAERMAASGDYEGALDMLRGALARAGSVALREDIQLRRVRLKRRALGEVLSARVGVPRDRVIAGDPLHVAFELTNRGAAPITIPAVDYERRLLVFRNPVGRTVVEVRLTLDEFDPRGTAVREVFTRFLEPERDIVIDPGETWSELFTVDSTTLRPRTLLLKRLRIDALVRPVRVRVADRDMFTSIELAAGELFVLPPGAESMIGDPFEHLRLAVSRAPREPRFLPHVLVAASLVRDAKVRDEARGFLLTVAERGDPVVRPSAARALALFWPERGVEARPPEPTPEVEFKPIAPAERTESRGTK